MLLKVAVVWKLVSRNSIKTSLVEVYLIILNYPNELLSKIVPSQLYLVSI